MTCVVKEEISKKKKIVLRYSTFSWLASILDFIIIFNKGNSLSVKSKAT